MKLTLIRDTFTPNSTTGRLLVNGQDECYVLEDTVRPLGEAKVVGKTAIPEGTYEVTITFSPRFQHLLPLLKGVPGFEGVRIHTGNKPEDTEGCLLVGTSRSEDWVGSSAVAFQSLFNKLKFALASGPVFITIESDPAQLPAGPEAMHGTHTKDHA